MTELATFLFSLHSLCFCFWCGCHFKTYVDQLARLQCGSRPWSAAVNGRTILYKGTGICQQVDISQWPLEVLQQELPIGPKSILPTDHKTKLNTYTTVWQNIIPSKSFDYRFTQLWYFHSKTAKGQKVRGLTTQWENTFKKMLAHYHFMLVALEGQLVCMRDCAQNAFACERFTNTSKLIHLKGKKWSRLLWFHINGKAAEEMLNVSLNYKVESQQKTGTNVVT